MPVARYAGADYILPGVLTSAKTWYHVVQSELFNVPAAILADEMIAPEYFKPGYLATVAPWPPYHRPKPDNRRDGKKAIGRADEPGPVLDHLGLVLLDKHYGPPHTADIERFETQVQDQYGEINHHNLLTNSTRNYVLPANNLHGLRVG
jgi:hypothetical protein